jgi:hypothetical protein
MAEAAWDPAANLMAAIINAAPYRSGRPVKPNEFNPFTRPAPAPPVQISVGDFLTVFGPPQKKRGGNPA